jgi:hypothetical protein
MMAVLLSHLKITKPTILHLGVNTGRLYQVVPRLTTIFHVLSYLLTFLALTIKKKELVQVQGEQTMKTQISITELMLREL